MKKLILILLTCQSFNSLNANADFIDDKFRLKSFIYEMRAEATEDCDAIVHDYNKSYEYYFMGKIHAYDDILYWLEGNDFSQ